MPCLAHEKVGIALNTLGNLPVNGVRHLVEGGTCGWYFWCGEELLTDEDFFKPLHFAHLDRYLPEVIPYTALSPGFRVLLSPNQMDVWYDPEMLV